MGGYAWPAWVWRDPEWRTALYLLGSPVLRDKSYHYVDLERHRIDVQAMLSASVPWSTGEQLLARLAADFFNGEGLVDFGELVRTLNLDRLTTALRLWQAVDEAAARRLLRHGS